MVRERDIHGVDILIRKQLFIAAICFRDAESIGDLPAFVQVATGDRSKATRGRLLNRRHHCIDRDACAADDPPSQLTIVAMFHGLHPLFP
ncbi:hypothetical protein D3C81_1216500 [compost metagenome]